MYASHGHPADAAIAAAAAASAAHEAAAMHAQYRPDEAIFNGVPPHPDAMQYGGFADPRDYFNAQVGGAGGLYYAPPQAPRLTAAAARASHYAAMYYDPSLHPQHAYSNQGASAAPWAAPYYNEYAAAASAAPGAPTSVPEYVPAGASVQHQDLEQQLIRQNQVSRMGQPRHQYNGDRHYEAHQPYDPRSSAGNAMPTNSMAGAYVPSMQAPAAEQEWGPWKPWHARQQQQHPQQQAYNAHESLHRRLGSLATQPTSPAEYQPSAQQDAPHHLSAPLSAGAHVGPRHSLGGGGGGLGQPWRQDTSRPVWNPAQWNRNFNSQAQRSLSQDMAMGAWQSQHSQQQGPSTWQDAPARGHQAPQRNDAWQYEQQPYVPTNHTSKPFMQEGQNIWGTALDAPYVPQHGANHAHNAIQHERQQQQQQYEVQRAQHEGQQQQAQWANDKNQAQMAQAQKVPSAPAPPSPNTLDKSAVPLTAIGAEIIWIAAAAMLDPILLQSFRRGAAISKLHTAVQRTSLSSSPNTSPDVANGSAWPPSSMGTSTHTSPSAFNVDALKADLMEDSSASSSEPSTPPPASAPSRQQKAKAYGSLSPEQGTLSAMDTFSAAVRPRPFYRSASHDRKKAAVDSIAELLNPNWRWSTNDDKLVSLRKPTTAVLSQSRSNASSPSSRRLSQRDDNANPAIAGVPISGTDPSPAFRRFANQVLSQTLVSPTAFMLSLLYALRVLQLALVDDDETKEAHLDQEAIEIFAQPPSAAPFKLLTLGLMIANKHLDDNTFLNKTWNEVTGITLPELNRMERWYLEKCSYEITVPHATWVAFLERLRVRHESRLVHMREARRRSQLPLTHLPSLNKSTSHIDALHSDAREGCDAKSHAAIMRPYRSGSGSGASSSSQHAGSASSTAVTEDALKRFLADTEDALHAVGQLPVFDLGSQSPW